MSKEELPAKKIKTSSLNKKQSIWDSWTSTSSHYFNLTQNPSICGDGVKEIYEGYSLTRKSRRHQDDSKTDEEIIPNNETVGLTNQLVDSNQSQKVDSDQHHTEKTFSTTLENSKSDENENKNTGEIESKTDEEQIPNNEPVGSNQLVDSNQPQKVDSVQHQAENSFSNILENSKSDENTNKNTVNIKSKTEDEDITNNETVDSKPYQKVASNQLTKENSKPDETENKNSTTGDVESKSSVVDESQEILESKNQEAKNEVSKNVDIPDQIRDENENKEDNLETEDFSSSTKEKDLDKVDSFPKISLKRSSTRNKSEEKNKLKKSLRSEKRTKLCEIEVSDTNVRTLRSKIQTILKSNDNEKSKSDEKSKKKLPLRRQISQKNAKIKNIRQQVKNVKISKVKSDHLKKNLSTKEVEKAQEIPLRRSKKLENESKITKDKNKSVKLQSQIKSEPKLDLVLSRRPRGMRKNPKRKVPKDF